MKHVMITGCTRGLGLAMLRSFAARGWRVSGCGTKQDAVERLAAELAKQGDGHVLRVCDVTSGENVAAMAAEILGSVGAPDLLLNNIHPKNQRLPNQATLTLKVKTNLFLTYSVFVDMLKNGSRRIRLKSPCL